MHQGNRFFSQKLTRVQGIRPKILSCSLCLSDVRNLKFVTAKIKLNRRALVIRYQNICVGFQRVSGSTVIIFCRGFSASNIAINYLRPKSVHKKCTLCAQTTKQQASHVRLRTSTYVYVRLRTFCHPRHKTSQERRIGDIPAYGSKTRPTRVM